MLTLSDSLLLVGLTLFALGILKGGADPHEPDSGAALGVVLGLMLTVGVLLYKGWDVVVAVVKFLFALILAVLGWR